MAYLFAAWQYLDLHVLKIATLPRYRRMGLARRLMRIAEEHTADRGGESVTLEVRESNREALSLYEGMGFTRVGSRRRYYSEPIEDAVLLAREGLGPGQP